MVLSRRQFTVFGFAAGLVLPQINAVAASDSTLTNTGEFTFESWDGPPLTVHYVEPETVTANAPIIIVMHGARRNADAYRDNWIALAQTYGFVVYAPEFSKAQFPKSNAYNMGGLTSVKTSAFYAIEPLFDAIKKRRQTKQKNYYIFGHSAGAQFVHRFVFFRAKTRYKMAIAANAGWYTLTSKNHNWPYGLGRLKSRRYNMKEAFQKPLMILLGDKDTDSNEKNLRKTPEAMIQGPHRRARGIYFLRLASAAAKASKFKLKWRFKVVPNVGHDNKGMAIAAAALIAKDAQEKNG